MICLVAPRLFSTKGEISVSQKNVWVRDYAVMAIGGCNVVRNTEHFDHSYSYFGGIPPRK